MATILKDDTTLEEQYNELQSDIKKLEWKIVQLKKKHRSNLILFAALGGGVLLILSALNPIGGLIGALIGWQLKWHQVAGSELKMIKTLKRELHPISKGLEGETSVTKLLKDSLQDDFIIINDITIPTKNGNGTQIDHLLITKKMIICVETKNITGTFYPHKEGWLWYQPSYGGRQKYVQKQTIIKSPQKQSIYHANQLRNLLKSNHIHIPVKPIVVLTNHNGVWKGNFDKHCPVVSINQLVPFCERVDKENESLGEISNDKLAAVLSVIREFV